jgi:hypothetical protein
MANIDAPLGFCPVRNEHGTVPYVESFQVSSGVEIFQHSPVALDGNGEVVAYTDTLALGGQLIGVAAHYVSSTQTDREILVYTDVNQEYELQADDATITSKGDSIGRLFRITNAAAGSSTTLQSTAEIDASSGASVTGTTAGTVTPIRIERESEQINNEKNVEFSRYIVRFLPGVMLRGISSVGLGATEQTGT